MQHDGMMGAISEAAEIAKETGCTPEEAFFSQRNLANLRIAITQAIAERALIPFNRLH
jgi:hypothetical protein